MRKNKQVLDILLIILCFVGVVVGLSIVVYLMSNLVFNNSNTITSYVLYFLGYGEIDNISDFVKIIISIFGISLIAIFSSVLTVKLLSFKKKIMVSKKALIINDGRDVLYVGINNIDHSVYDLEVSVEYINLNEKHIQKEKVPYLSKNAKYILKLDAGVGSPVNRYLYDYLYNPGKIGNFYFLITYVDGVSGETERVCQEYLYKEGNSDFVFCLNQDLYIDKYEDFCSLVNRNDLQSIEDYVKDNYLFDLSKAKFINERFLDIDNVIKDRDKLSGTLDFLDEENDFFMFVLDNPYPDWKLFSDNNLFLEFDLDINENLKFSLEVKDSTGKKLFLDVSDYDSISCFESGHFKIPMGKNQNSRYFVDYDHLDDVKEVCLTFWNNKTSNMVTIKNLRISK